MCNQPLRTRERGEALSRPTLLKIKLTNRSHRRYARGACRRRIAPSPLRPPFLSSPLPSSSSSSSSLYVRCPRFHQPFPLPSLIFVPPPNTPPRTAPPRAPPIPNRGESYRGNVDDDSNVLSAHRPPPPRSPVVAEDPPIPHPHCGSGSCCARVPLRDPLLVPAHGIGVAVAIDISSSVII